MTTGLNGFPLTTQNPVIHMKPDQWINQLNAVTRDFRETFGSLTHEQMNWKPDQHTWSIAQNIDHLITLNESYYPVFEAVRSGTYRTPFIGKLGFIASFLGKTLLQAVQPDRKRKVKTFPVWEPARDAIPAGILIKFEAHQEELKREKQSLEGKKGTVISSPANKNIVYTLEAAFDIILAHEQRHFEQAKEVLTRLPEGAGEAS